MPNFKWHRQPCTCSLLLLFRYMYLAIVVIWDGAASFWD